MNFKNFQQNLLKSVNPNPNKREVFIEGQKDLLILYLTGRKRRDIPHNIHIIEFCSYLPHCTILVVDFDPLPFNTFAFL